MVFHALVGIFWLARASRITIHRIEPIRKRASAAGSLRPPHRHGWQHLLRIYLVSKKIMC